jgi:hypothetical protein
VPITSPWWVANFFVIRRWLERHYGATISFSPQLPVYVARLGGAALSLHIFYGAGSIGQFGGDSFLVSNSSGLAVWNYQ